MVTEARARSYTWLDYLALTKPRVVLLHIVTAGAALFLAANGPPRAGLLAATLFGGALMAGAANALNCYFDRDIDALMERTARRPLPAGRVNPGQALLAALIIGMAGFAILQIYAGWKPAALSLGALVYYSFVYTLMLKRQTVWSTLAGSGAGAFPPVIGWVAVTGHISAAPFLLFAIIVLWTPPHFWSLAIFRQRDYAGAGLTMAPAKSAPFWALGFGVGLLAATLGLVPLAGLGHLYMGVALGLGLILIALATGMTFGREKLKFARRLYVYSIIYLALLFTAMVVDKMLGA